MDSTIQGEVKRKGGQWIITLYVAEWVVDDILRDSDSSVHSVIRLETVYPAVTKYYGDDKPAKVLGSIRFEETT